MTGLDKERRDELRRRDEGAGRAPAVARDLRPRADELPCGNCGEAPPGPGLRRHVPHRSRTLPVCPPCAEVLDDQLVLEARGLAQVERAVDHYERVTGSRPSSHEDAQLLCRWPRPWRSEPPERDILALMRDCPAA